MMDENTIISSKKYATLCELLKAPIKTIISIAPREKMIMCGNIYMNDYI
jgi:hypothetical protein